MAPKHDQIIKQLDGGWSVVWDTTKIDPATRHAIDEVAKTNANALKAILADSFREADLLVDRPDASQSSRADRPRTARQKSGSGRQPRVRRPGRSAAS